MFRSKSFQVITEPESHKRERLYEPKRIRWMKYIVLPAIISFMLLLILSNVDFTGDAYTTTAPSTTTTRTTLSVESTTTREVQTTLLSDNWAIVDGSTPDGLEKALTGRSPNRFVGALFEAAAATNPFRCDDKKSCDTVVCSGGSVYGLAEKLEYFEYSCAEPFNLLMEYCTFPRGRLDKNVFKGDFKLKNITINDCGLEHIDDNALEQNSLSQLQTLVFIKSLFIELNEKTFTGLKKLERFEMSNQQRLTPLRAVNFLKPVASSLQTVALKHQQSTTSTVYDPAGWLGGAKFTKLTYVDMSENVFSDSLTHATFVNLAAVKQLILASSGINSIAERTFDAVLGTLSFLDLTGNALKTLDTNFLKNAALKGVRVELHGNAWSCDCENESFVEAITSAALKFSEEPKCATPGELKDVAIRDAKLKCGLTTTVATTTAAAVTSTQNSPITTTTTTNSNQSTDTDNTTTKGASTSESSNTNYTNETSSANTSETEEGNDSTGDVTFSTTSITPTTSTSSSSVPPICSNGLKPGYVWCRCGKVVKWWICDSDAGFSMETTSSTAVRLVIQGDMDDLNVIHFTRKNLTDSASKQGYLLQRSGITSIGIRTEGLRNTTIVDITGLTTTESHVFCLVPNGNRTISPFNCRSQFLDVAWPQSWLRKSDMALFLPLTVGAVLLCVLLGLVAIYLFLRWRPSWLRGNERLRRLDSTSHQVLLFSSPDRSSIDQEQHTLRELGKMRASVADTLTPENCFNIKSYDYMQYYKNSEQSKHQSLLHTFESLPPVHRAPALPPNPSSAASSIRHTSSQSTVRVEDVRPGDIVINRHSDHSQKYGDNEYESLEYYQEIYA